VLKPERLHSNGRTVLTAPCKCGPPRTPLLGHNATFLTTSTIAKASDAFAHACWHGAIALLFPQVAPARPSNVPARASALPSSDGSKSASHGTVIFKWGRPVSKAYRGPLGAYGGALRRRCLLRPCALYRRSHAARRRQPDEGLRAQHGRMGHSRRALLTSNQPFRCKRNRYQHGKRSVTAWVTRWGRPRERLECRRPRY
jgi:hypothetical protein